MRNDHSHFVDKENFPSTYFILVPNELLRLLDAYYFGPLEITIEYDDSLSPFDELLTVNHFNVNNQVDSLIEIIIPFADLIEKYKSNPEDGGLGGYSNNVGWTKDVYF